MATINQEAVTAGSKITGLPGIGIFGIGKQLNIDLGGKGKGEGADSKAINFPIPADPNKVLENVGKGSWMPLGRTARISPVVWGQDPDNAGASIEVDFSSYSGRFVWLRPGNRDKIRPADGEPSGGGGKNPKKVKSKPKKANT